MLTPGIDVGGVGSASKPRKDTGEFGRFEVVGGAEAEGGEASRTDSSILFRRSVAVLEMTRSLESDFGTRGLRLNGLDEEVLSHPLESRGVTWPVRAQVKAMASRTQSRSG
jgi:hypothetical protein